MDKPLKDILRLFQAEPSRTWSIVMTFFGDMVLPRGGSIGLPTLLSLFHAMDVGSGTVRTALSRLSADGWVERTRIGRNAYYCLSSRGTALSRDAEPRIYGTFSFKTQRKLRLAVASASVRSLVGDEAALVATRMREAGYTAFAPGAWLGVDDGTLPDGVFGLDVNGSQVAMQCLAAYFSLDDLARSYLRFEKIFSPLAKMCTDHAEQKGRSIRMDLVPLLRALCSFMNIGVLPCVIRIFQKRSCHLTGPDIELRLYAPQSIGLYCQHQKHG